MTASTRLAPFSAVAIGAAAIAAVVALSCGPREEIRRTAYADGRPWTELHYRDGKAEGSFTTWYRNGQKANAGGNLAGRLHGKVVEWHEDGTVVLEANYDRGYLDGPWREHWPDGKDRCTANYQKGRLDGLYSEWSREGNKVLEGRYVGGLREGEWTGWFPDGKPRGKPFVFVHGELKSDLERSQSGEGK